MAINKNPIVRYRALDKCFSSNNKRYYMEDLIEACCKALEHVNGDSGSKGAEGVKRRQIYEDMKNMQLMYDVIIEAHYDGHKKYYRYEGSRTMADSGPSQEEIDIMMNAVAVLQRFEGVPHFDWLNDLNNKLYTTSKLGNNTQKVVSFQHNPYLTGMGDWYKPAFEAILAHKVLEIVYHPFGKDVRTVTVSPYHLKQYNNRWFLIGHEHSNDRTVLSNYGIDRIEDIKETNSAYIPLEDDFDFDEWFSDVVGVSVTPGAPVEDVILHVNDDAWPYISTKPLHESQCILNGRKEDGRWEIRLKVQVNYELCSLLFSYGDEIKVMSPASLRQKMKDMAERVSNMYKD